MTKTSISTNRITIDDLAGMISRLENKLVLRIDGLEGEMNSKFDKLEEKMNFRFDGVQNQLDRIYLDYTPRREHLLLQGRVRKIERKVGIKSIV